ncbi:hypothetical protein [Allorhizocola rhizosphaerae]|uniref:hypothetical protein n=1 Tax=Allorhizocola rhizosphaerae TaxID=1872709 RepID=UPI000E3D2830|nr:hypothetical protein [Allorhizocola rhizosphaerae]
MPACPYTASQVSEILGQPMTDQGACLFGDGKGVAGFGATMPSRLAGSSTYDYQREQAGKPYDRVSTSRRATRPISRPRSSRARPC